ncbi:uncharacterized protein LOC143282008 isoform X2 [Babylonia areolata]|uniref:uncharacterized protein LOC143282008 isoform X2 n=1 Tax=Babylonia areolata TaxID=304850 RepID=UPI003FD5739B
MAAAAKTRGLYERLRATLNSLCCESTVVTFTLLSVLAITGEILIDYGILTAPPDNKNQQGSSNYTTASGQREALETVQTVFHYTSLAIAACFFLEMLIKIAAFRWKFFKQPWQMVDLVVVCASLGVEIAFEINGRLSELEVCTFVIIFRLWRLPHACNIRARKVQRDLEQEIEVWKAGASKMQDRCNTLDSKNAKQKDKIERLEREVAALKTEIKDSNGGSRKPNYSATVPNGAVPRDPRHAASSSNQRAAAPPPKPPHGRGDQATLKSPHGLVESEDDSTIDGSPGKGTRRLREEEEETEEDTVGEEEGEEGEEAKRGGNYFRSGSESSLSCHAVQQEVHVQIEDEAMTSQQKAVVQAAADNSAVNTPVQMRRKIVYSEEKKGWAAAGRAVCYENSAFVPDLDEGDHFEGELMHEIDGARTYRSAEGIPMTDL